MTALSGILELAMFNHTEQIEYKGLIVEVQRKAFRRRLTIVLKPRQPVTVKAARLTPLSMICAFLESRRPWIEKVLKEFREEEKSLPAWKLRVGETYPFMGRDLKIKTAVTPLRKPFFAATDDDLILYLPVKLAPLKLKPLNESADLSFAHEALRNFYRQQGEKFLKARAEFWSEQSGLKPSRVSVREARSRWGSCNSRGSISLNWRLMVFRPEVIDYVVVHELAHLKQANHSKHFWNLVKEILPSAHTLMKELRDQQRQSDFLERLGTGNFLGEQGMHPQSAEVAEHRSADHVG